MVNFKSMLLAATVVAGAVASPALAQQIPLPAPSTPDAALRGAGASSIQNIVVRNFNCIGLDQKRGSSSSITALTTILPGNYAGNPALDCAIEANNIQPNIAGKYVSTGSGFGRTMWRDFSNDFAGGTGSTPTTGVFNPHVTAPAVWANLQYAFSDAGVSTSDIGTYNNRAALSAGAAVTFPLFLLPVAIAYSSTYGTNAANNAMVFNARGRGITTVTGAVAPAVLKLSKAAYCGIFNGTLVNWNAPAFKSLNSNTPLFDLTNDTAARWNTDGAPIRLVGRLDRSGTTDIFARHLAAVCNPTSAPGVAPLGTNPGVPAFAGLNKFLQAAETLPYATSTGVNFRSVRGDVNYHPTVSAASLAGTTNSISGDYWNGTAILNIGTGSVAFPSTAGSTSMPTGNVGSGLFLLADGSARVATGIASAPDYALNGVLLNGKIGYISSDFIYPSVDAPGGLQAATLQVGVSTTLYANPTPSAARSALATILPPQTDSAGLYVATDTRMVRPTSGTALVSATRANPIAWTDVLYSDPAGSLAAPALGYPITGTTQFLGYTCYNGGNREAMVNHLATVLGQIGKNSTGGALSRGVFSAVTPGAQGIDVQSLIGVVPTSWAKAITNTFLSNSADAGTLNLWIQSAVTPAYQNVNNPLTGLPYVPARPNIRTATTANSTCTGLSGA